MQLKSRADELRKRALTATDEETRHELLILAERYEQLSQVTEQRRFPYMRLPKSLFH